MKLNILVMKYNSNEIKFWEINMYLLTSGKLLPVGIHKGGKAWVAEISWGKACFEGGAEAEGSC